FDLGLYRGGIAKTVTLEKPGVVSVYCNIHSQMNGNVLVVPNPYYARVGGDGRFEIHRVPRGTWHAVVWSSFGAPGRETVQVEPEYPHAASVLPSWQTPSTSQQPPHVDGAQGLPAL